MGVSVFKDNIVRKGIKHVREKVESLVRRRMGGENYSDPVVPIAKPRMREEDHENSIFTVSPDVHI